MELAYDRVLRIVERHPNVFINPTYRETLRAAHIFQLPPDVYEIVNHYNVDIALDNHFKKENMIMMPFDNIWLDIREFSGAELGDTLKGCMYGAHILKLGKEPYYGANFYLLPPLDTDRKPFFGLDMHLFSALLKPKDHHDPSKEYAVDMASNVCILPNAEPCCRFASAPVCWVDHPRSDEERDKHIKILESMSLEEAEAFFHETYKEGEDAVKSFWDKMNKVVYYDKFCAIGWNKHDCSQLCESFKKGIHWGVSMLQDVVSFINLPCNRVLKVVSREQKEAEAKGKKVRGIFGDKRPHYIILDHAQAREIYEDSEEAKSDAAPRRGHERRAHRRHCMGRTQNGKWIPYAEHKQTQWVKQCWVGSREFTVGQQIYEVI
ncbi:MAG: hypothetical protein WC517_04515, partial [Patescibacteria group bacterium]